MKALYYADWGKLEIREVPRPTLADGEILVRVTECGICGSELDTFRTESPRRPPPLIMGHEFSGYVQEARNTHHRWEQGCRVVSHALVHCGRCTLCVRGDTNLCVHRQVFGMHRPGALAEYVAVPERVLLSWPADAPNGAAVFVEPLANGINAMRQGPTARRSRVVVIGAGPIGLMCVLAAKRLHQSNVIVADRIPERLLAARRLGADLTVDVFRQSLPEEMSRLWSGERAEFVVDAVGSSDTKLLSVDLVEPGGMVVWVGLHDDLIQLNSYALTIGQKCVSGTYSGSMFDFQEAARLLSIGSIDTSWATRYPLEQGDTAFRNMLMPQGSNIKAILQFDQSTPY
jgi:threonine dehydrogenase-like Zn-dependent dehydrogenase